MTTGTISNKATKQALSKIKAIAAQDPELEGAESKLKNDLSTLMLSVGTTMKPEDAVVLIYMISFYYMATQTLPSDDFEYISKRANKLTEKVME